MHCPFGDLHAPVFSKISKRLGHVNPGVEVIYGHKQCCSTFADQSVFIMRTNSIIRVKLIALNQEVVYFSEQDLTFTFLCNLFRSCFVFRFSLFLFRSVALQSINSLFQFFFLFHKHIQTRSLFITSSANFSL